MVDNQYTYAVARIRSKELSLLSDSNIDQLLACKDYKACLQLLIDKGWGNGETQTVEELLTFEREKTWDLIKELVEDLSVFDILLIENDFHNLKAAIKQVYTDTDVPNIYIKNATIDHELIYKAVKEHDFTLIPEYMRESAEEAYTVQLHTGDGQLCDVILDKATLDTIYSKSKESDNELLTQYAEQRIVVADIKIALRGHKTGKSKDFFERAIAKCESLDKSKLIECALAGEEEIFEYLLSTDYADAVQEIKTSASAFEKWCDNLIIKHIKPQKYNPFTLAPLIAYILARENEIKNVRILLSGKLNNLSDDSIRERLRDMYV